MERERKGNPFGRIQGQPMRPPMVAIDRFGKQIEAGHLIMFHVEEDSIFEVVSVLPVLNPSVPGGQAIQIELQAKFKVAFQPAMANRGIVICGESKARQEEMAARNGGGSQPTERRSEGGIILPADITVDDGGPSDEGADLVDRSQTPTDDDDK